MDKKNKIIQRTIVTVSELCVREAAEGEAKSRIIDGYAILFNTPSAPFFQDEKREVREVIAPEAITREFLDKCDIKLTMFHDRQLILGRSNNGSGTLSYEVDEKGVKFTCEAPNTVDGDKALELVRRGDIAGCSFAFSTYYYDEEWVEHKIERDSTGFIHETYIVRAVTGIYDFTLAADPAYPDTTVEAREFVESLREAQASIEEPAPDPAPAVNNSYREQVAAMRKAARHLNI